MERLRNSLVEYAWGSRTALAELLGEPSPSPRPQAEMWMGTHPLAPSSIEGAPTATTLADRIAASPAATLGDAVRVRFHSQLPFLFKVLAVDSPLSLQAHPSLAQAREGFAREEAAGIARSAANRSYRDANHKPEILCALGPFEALCGFRPSAQTAGLFASLRCDCAAALADGLERRPGERGLREAFERLMTMNPRERAGLLDDLLEGCRQALDAGSQWERELRWTLELAARYPGDVGAASALMLNLVHLDAGEAIFLPSGNLHCYLAGVGVELMANSDNVLRGGLTPKHVDVAELLRVLDFRDGPVAKVATRAIDRCETAYETAAEDFRLSRVELHGAGAWKPERRGPEILLCVEGRCVATTEAGTSVELRKGTSVFVSAGDGPYTLGGDAKLFRATVGVFA